MTVTAAFALGVGATIIATFVVLLVVDRDLRRAAAEVGLAVLVGPALLLMAVARRGPRAKRISPEALERFAGMQGDDMEPAWLLAYGGRGVIFLRRRDQNGWRNNVPNRASDAVRGNAP